MARGEANSTEQGKWHGARQMARGEANGTERGKMVQGEANSTGRGKMARSEAKWYGARQVALFQGVRPLRRDRAVHESYSKSVGSPNQQSGKVRGALVRNIE